MKRSISEILRFAQNDIQNAVYHRAKYMPEISRFLGIVIYMYLQDHEPPHFHAHYQGYRSVWSIEKTTLIAGDLPPRIARLVRRWAQIHKQELRENWELRTQNERPKRINPL